jgi:hypothetical protein
VTQNTRLGSHFLSLFASELLPLFSELEVLESLLPSDEEAVDPLPLDFEPSPDFLA